MARQLDKTEGMVYQELSKLRLSIYETFLSLLPTAKALLKTHSLSEVAGQLGVGEQALSFILHYDGELNRGVKWGREFFFEGRYREEEDILIALRERGKTLQEIAEHLNYLAGTETPSHPEIRTAGAVAARLGLLGLTNSTKKNPLTKEIPGYGLVKKHGRLEVEAAKRFLVENRLEDLDWLAGEVGLERNSLRQFADRHDIELSFRKIRRLDAVQKEMLLSRYNRYREEESQAFSADTGGFKYFVDYAKLRRASPEAKLGTNADEWFLELSNHLPETEKRALKEIFPLETFSKFLGFQARTSPSQNETTRLSSRERIYDLLRGLMDAHNEAVKEDGLRPGYYRRALLDPKLLSTSEGVERVLREIRGETEKKEERAAFSMDTGGFKYFLEELGKTSPESKFGKTADKWFLELGNHLPERERKVLREIFPLEIVRRDLGHRTRNSPNETFRLSSRGRVYDLLRGLIDAHNEAVRQNEIAPGYYPKTLLDPKALSTSEGVERVLQEIRR